MTWVRVDDRFPEHCKVVEAGSSLGPYGEGRVVAVWLVGMAYCNRNETDGLVKAITIGTWTRFDRRPIEVAEAMARRMPDGSDGLLVKEGDSFRFHDYLVYQPSKADLTKKRQKDRDRKHPKGFHTDSERNPEGSYLESERIPVGIREASGGIPLGSRARDPDPGPIPEDQERKFTGASRAGIYTLPVENARVLKALVWRETHAIYGNPNEEYSLPNLTELLKCKAARAGLAYDGDFFHRQVETAFARVPLQFRRSA